MLYIYDRCKDFAPDGYGYTYRQLAWKLPKKKQLPPWHFKVPEDHLKWQNMSERRRKAEQKRLFKIKLREKWIQEAGSNSSDSDSDTESCDEVDQYLESELAKPQQVVLHIWKDNDWLYFRPPKVTAHN